MYRLLLYKERNGFLRTIAFCILCCMVVKSFGQTKPLKDSSGGISKNQLEFDIIQHQKFIWSVSPVLTPPEYKYFDNDPLDLFTRIGLRLSTNFRYHTQSLGNSEYQNEHLLSVNYGFLRKTLVIGYVGTLRQLVGHWDGLLKARYDVVAVENFYGLGNNTINDTKTARNFYVSSSDREYASAGLSRDFSSVHHVEASLFYQRIRVNSTGNHY